MQSAAKRSRQTGPPLFSQLLNTPIGPMIAVAGDGGVALLEFTDAQGVEHRFSSTQRLLHRPILPGGHPLLDRLQRELNDYFSGQRRNFSVPLLPAGSDFQKLVWSSLRNLPFGQTIHYQALATRLGRPTASRAVARANGSNRLYLLIPCHRVMGKDNKLCGYGGGIWRKQWLLDWEKSHMKNEAATS